MEGQNGKNSTFMIMPCKIMQEKIIPCVFCVNIDFLNQKGILLTF
jgi:hypothetical protein